MTVVPVRILVTRFGQAEADVLETEVSHDEAIVDVESRLGVRAQVGESLKWIYMGRKLDSVLPAVVHPHSSFHVIVSRSAIRDSGETSATKRGSKLVLNFHDKIALGFIYSVFTYILCLSWYRMKFSSPWAETSTCTANVTLYLLTLIWSVSLIQLARRRFNSV